MPLILTASPDRKGRSGIHGNWNIYILLVGSGIAYWFATGIPSVLQQRASRRLGAYIPPFLVGHLFFAVFTTACW